MSLSFSCAQSSEIQFFGATTLHTKLLKHWHEVPEANRDELRQKLFQSIILYANGPKIVLNRLCISVCAIFPLSNSRIRSFITLILTFSWVHSSFIWSLSIQQLSKISSIHFKINKCQMLAKKHNHGFWWKFWVQFLKRYFSIAFVECYSPIDDILFCVCFRQTDQCDVYVSAKSYNTKWNL